MGSALPLLGGGFGACTCLETALTLTGRDKMASTLLSRRELARSLALLPAPFS